MLDGDPESSIKELSRARFGYGIFYKKLINFDGLVHDFLATAELFPCSSSAFDQALAELRQGLA